MSSQDQMDRRYKALDHPMRRRIVRLLAEEPRTYTQLLNELRIESGHLAYHIRSLDVLLDKDESDNYVLNVEGVKAHDFLAGKQGTRTTASSEKTFLLAVSVLILVIAGAILIVAPGKWAQHRYEEQISETYALSLQALDIVYEIFEDWDIPRDHWAALLLKTVEIKSNLIDLHEFTDDPKYLELSERLGYYETELSSVIVVGDPGYTTLTVEKRYLIRELHTLLLEIEEAL